MAEKDILLKSGRDVLYPITKGVNVVYGATDSGITLEEKVDEKLASTDAASTYLAKSDAATTYLTKTDAGTTYLSKSDASSTYATKSSLATVATSGSYNDLTNKPTIPAAVTVDQTYDGTSTNAQSGVAVKSAIDTAISSVYKPAGSVAFASLPTLGASVLGNVYNVTDSFTTTADFVEGAGNSYPAGTNVVVVEPTSGTYKFDVLAGFVDLSGYQQTATAVTHTESTAAGSATQPVYIAADGTATATTYSLAKSVPADAVFTDTTYTAGANISISGTTVSAPNVYTKTNLLAGNNVTITENSALDSDTVAYFKMSEDLEDSVSGSSSWTTDSTYAVDFSNAAPHFNADALVTAGTLMSYHVGSAAFNNYLSVDATESFTVDYFLKCADTTLASVDIVLPNVASGQSGYTYEFGVYNQEGAEYGAGYAFEVFSNKSSAVTVSAFPTLDTDWHHYAYVWDASNSRFSVFVDGVLCKYLDNPTFSGSAHTQSQGLAFSLRSSGLVYLQGLRVSSTARWTADFTVPTDFYDAASGEHTYSISAANTTYSTFVGTDGSASGSVGLVPAPATTDTNKYLKSDGTWATVASGDSLPDQTGQSGKFLTTDGTTASWATVSGGGTGVAPTVVSFTDQL